MSCVTNSRNTWILDFLQLPICQWTYLFESSRLRKFPEKLFHDFLQTFFNIFQTLKELELSKCDLTRPHLTHWSLINCKYLPQISEISKRKVRPLIAIVIVITYSVFSLFFLTWQHCLDCCTCCSCLLIFLKLQQWKFSYRFWNYQSNANCWIKPVKK